jgi:hypothetical protein
MGAVITFPELRRVVRESPQAMRRVACVIILPVIRIERDSDPAATQTRTPRSKSRPCRKRREPATRT